MSKRNVSRKQIANWQDYHYATAMAHPLQGINSFHGENLWLDNIVLPQLGNTQGCDYAMVTVPGLHIGNSYPFAMPGSGCALASCKVATLIAVQLELFSGQYFATVQHGKRVLTVGLWQLALPIA